MAVDPKIVEAIEEAVGEEGQSEALARRLVAWFDAIASGNEDINDPQSANRHLELIYGETQVGGELVDYDIENPFEGLLDSEESE